MIRHGRSEYLVLRRTIAQRGALRHILVVCGIGVWALTLTAVLVWMRELIAFQIPLIALLATFEAIRPLHFGAERIGRYLQVFYEENGETARPLRDTPSWERVAMRFGTVPGVGGHPLFLPVFVLAIAVNYMASISLRPGFWDHVLNGVIHAGFGAWVVSADRAVKKQREIELERMRHLAGN
jgi:hypothetical protein